MKAMVLTKIYNLKEHRNPLQIVELPVSGPAETEILIRALTGGVFRTKLDEIEGRTPFSQFQMILGHQVVWRVESVGKNAHFLKFGDSVDVIE